MPSSKIMLQPDLERSALPVFNGLVSAAGKSMTGARGRAAGQFVDLADIPERAWSDLAARNSPGVQLTLDLTRHSCEDAGIDDVDSTADADHPMIDHVWRGRQPLCHLFAPTQPNNFITDIVSGVIAGRAIARAQGRRLARALRHFREK